MPKGVKYSPVAGELKKEYLREHLESVKTLIRDWMLGLHSPEPLSPNNHLWGWQSRYRLLTQDNPDDNHVLRHHLKSRALWSHYGQLETKLEEIWDLANNVRLEAKVMIEKQSTNSPRKYTQDYVPLALWKAFNLELGKTMGLTFRGSDDALGLICEAYEIEESANTTGQRQLIEKEFRSLITSVIRTPAMKDLTKSWLEAGQLEAQISMIADTTLKSGDIFYECRFCRHLWK
jgi:hypothetical protein